jgi:hypothetical protein
MHKIFQGVRPLDYVLAGLMTAAGAFLMYENISAGDDASLPHPLSTTTWAMLPVFLLVTIPILWRRRNVLAVVGATAVATVLHVVLFGWVTRCGVALPLSIALAYAVARFARGRRDHLIGLTGILLLQVVVIARDASIDRLVSALPLSIPAAALFYGMGLYVQNRVTRKQQQEQSAAVPPVAQRAAV